MSVVQISEKLISWDGNQYRKINPRKKYIYKLDGIQKKKRAAYMRMYRINKKPIKSPSPPLPIRIQI